MKWHGHCKTSCTRKTRQPSLEIAVTATSLSQTAPASTVRAIAPGHDDRFNVLIAIHRYDLYRFTYWSTGSRSVAEELAQDAPIRAWKSIDRMKRARAATGWLPAIVRRENARRFERQRLDEADTEGPGDEPADNLTSTEACVLRGALDRLPPECREPLPVQLVYGYSPKEIAAHLGITNAGAGTRLFSAREKRRSLL